jgi:hypothetical protein
VATVSSTNVLKNCAIFVGTRLMPKNWTDNIHCSQTITIFYLSFCTTRERLNL